MLSPAALVAGQLPANVDLERNLLAATLWNSDSGALVHQILGPDDFYSSQHAALFRLFARIREQEGDLTVEIARLGCAGKPHASKLIDELMQDIDASMLLPGVVERACVRLRNIAISRRLAEAALEVAARACEPGVADDPEAFIDAASSRVADAIRDREASTKGERLADLCGEIVQGITDPQPEDQRQLAPVPLRALSGIVSGWEPGRLYVVAGRPGSGKSAFGAQSLECVARDGRRGLFFSGEMLPREQANRLVSGAASVDGKALARRSMSRGDQASVLRAAVELGVLDIEIVNAARLSIEQMSLHARRRHMREPLGMVVFDYLQLFRSRKLRSASPREHIDQCSRELKLLAMELGIPIMCLSQLNRDMEREERPPRLSDLRESGAIEQDADTVIFIWQPDANSPDAREIIVGKQRGGDTGRIAVNFERRFTRFSDTEPPL